MFYILAYIVIGMLAAALEQVTGTHPRSPGLIGCWWPLFIVFFVFGCTFSLMVWAFKAMGLERK